MTHRFVTVTLCVLGLGASTATAAQQPPPQQQQREKQQEPRQGHAQRPFILSDEIIGTDIENPNGERISRIEQLVIERETGRVKYAIADVGGFLGLGAREVAVPWSDLQTIGPDTYVLDRSAEDLRKAPEFNEREWLGIENLAEWEQEIEEFFGAERHEMRGRAEIESEEKEPAKTPATEAARQEPGDPKLGLTRPLVLSDQLIGTDIENQQKESLGKIEQLIIERDGNQVKFAVVDVAGFLGVGEREVAVPYESLKVTGEDGIALTRGADQLQNAPVFDEDEWLAMEDYDQWQREVDEFFGTKVTENR